MRDFFAHWFGHVKKRASVFNGRMLALCFVSLLICFSIKSTIALDSNSLRDNLIANTGVEADFVEWKALLEAARKQPQTSALKLVNDFFNQKIKFESDVVVWNKNDYWATPMQSYGIKRGDCEDFAIAKYFSLAAAGVPEDKMRLMYVQALQYNQAHMVLAYYPSPEAEPLVLDNLNHEILPASARSDLKPVFSLARRDLGGHSETQDTAARMREAQRQTRMSVWQELIKRAQKEGFD